jgi:hypothetical protein
MQEGRLIFQQLVPVQVRAAAVAAVVKIRVREKTEEMEGAVVVREQTVDIYL